MVSPQEGATWLLEEAEVNKTRLERIPGIPLVLETHGKTPAA